MKQFAATQVFGGLNSVFVEDHQVFGSGSTQQEARNATIVSAFEYIETKGLEIDVGKIYVANLTKGPKPKQPQWMKNLKGKERY